MLETLGSIDWYGGRSTGDDLERAIRHVLERCARAAEKSPVKLTTTLSSRALNGLRPR